MRMLLVLASLLQADATVTIPESVVIHDANLRLKHKLNSQLSGARERLIDLAEELQYDEISAELAKQYQLTANNRPEQMVAMSVLLNAVAWGRDGAFSSKNAAERKPLSADSIRRINLLCRPYVDAVVIPEVSIPACPDLLGAQLNMVRAFHSNVGGESRKDVEEHVDLRKAYARRLCLVWSRVVKSCIVYREVYSEDVMTGAAKHQLPMSPVGVLAEGGQTDPKSIKDPVKRKAYEQYLVAYQQELDRYSVANRMHRVRSSYLPSFRTRLESLYGEDRTKWDELRLIAKETIKEPEIADLVIKDFTRRKEPGIWP